MDRVGLTGVRRRKVTRSRSISQWSTDDYEGVKHLARRIIEYVEGNEPNTLVFEWYGDEASGTIMWHQVYANEEAFLQHAANMREAGFLDDAFRLLKSEWSVILEPPTTPRGRRMQEQMGVVQLDEVEGSID